MRGYVDGGGGGGTATDRNATKCGYDDIRRTLTKKKLAGLKWSTGIRK